MEQDSTIFVVSTDKGVIQQIRALMDPLPAAVERFGSITEFLQAGAGAGRSGCLLLDARSGLPKLSGAAESVEAIEIEIPVVVLTGPPSARLQAGGSLAGAIGRALEEASSARIERGQQDEIEHRLESLTRREREVMALVVEGMSNKMIAYTLGISARTIEIHRARAMHKMGAESLSELVRMACLVGAAQTDEPAPTEPLMRSGSR